VKTPGSLSIVDHPDILPVVHPGARSEIWKIEEKNVPRRAVEIVCDVLNISWFRRSQEPVNFPKSFGC